MKMTLLFWALIFSTCASAETNCVLPGDCYNTNGSLREEDTPEGDKVIPECLTEKKVCPSYCKSDSQILDAEGNATGKLKPECMSNLLIKYEKEEVDREKRGEEEKKLKAKRDAEESKRIRAAMAKDGVEQAKKAKAAFALASDPKKFAQCYCNFGRCLGPRKASCTTLDSCREVTADVYATAVANREALLVLNSHAFCVNPTAGFMRGE